MDVLGSDRIACEGWEPSVGGRTGETLGFGRGQPVRVVNLSERSVPFRLGVVEARTCETGGCWEIMRLIGCDDCATTSVSNTPVFTPVNRLFTILEPGAEQAFLVAASSATYWFELCPSSEEP
jgi:hypothetical protein